MMNHFSKMGYTNCPHAGNKSLIIMAIILFNKVNWRKEEEICFIPKTDRTFRRR